jgi:hypothetical protein
MNRPVQMKITDEELWGEAPLAATFENVQVGYDLLVLSYGIGQESWALLVKWVEDPEFRAKYPTKRFLEASAETGNEHDETYSILNIQNNIAQIMVSNTCILPRTWAIIRPTGNITITSWSVKTLWARKHFPRTTLCALKWSLSIAF